MATERMRSGGAPATSSQGGNGGAPARGGGSAQRAEGGLPFACSRSSAQRGRLLVFSASFLMIAFLLWYGYRYSPSVTLRMCLNNPQRHDGVEIGIGAETTVISLHEDGFDISYLGYTVRVEGDAQDAAVGDFVQMRAIYHKEGYLQLRQLYVAKGRRTKILASTLPALLVIVLFFRKYRFDARHVLFRERR